MDVLHSGIIQPFFLILISATFTDNILLTRFLGMCSCLGVSKKVDTSLGLGLAVIFVTACTAAINFIIYEFLLIPLGIAYLKLIVFIIVIAAFVQFVEMVIERVSIKLYFSLGIFLPLITSQRANNGSPKKVNIPMLKEYPNHIIIVSAMYPKEPMKSNMAIHLGMYFEL